MSDHTPEPWMVSPVPNDWLIRTADQRLSIAEVFPDSAGTEIAEWHANARRIVACVNACAGIPTDVIEAKVRGELKVAFLRLDEEPLPGELTALRQQVADLRAALERAAIAYHAHELHTQPIRECSVPFCGHNLAVLAATQPQEVQP